MSNPNNSTMDDLTAMLRQSQISETNTSRQWNAGPPGLQTTSQQGYGHTNNQPFQQSPLPSQQQATAGSGLQITPAGRWNDYRQSPHGRSNQYHGYSQPQRQSTYPPPRNVSLMDYVRGGSNSSQDRSLNPPPGLGPLTGPSQRFVDQAEMTNPRQQNINLARQQTFPSHSPSSGSHSATTRTRDHMFRTVEQGDNSPASSFHSSPNQQNRHNRRARPPDFEVFVSQCQYLDELVANEVPLVAITTEELMEKEKFRQQLRELCRSTIKTVFPNLTYDIDLVPYGSIQSGFATKNSDMDLLFTWKNGPSMRVGDTLGVVTELLETAILNAGCGARLISKTRVPVLKICQFPSDELRRALFEERQKAEDEREAESLGDLVKNETESSNPDSTKEKPNAQSEVIGSGEDGNRTEQAEEGAQKTTQTENRQKKWFRERPPGALDFPKTGVGIQCDIGFTKFLGIYNTQLLRCYASCDPRVKDLVLFIKSWAKNRRINSSYNGTLSSYGWALMVLHYLINIVTPPVLPNLQLDMSRNGSERKKFEGYDIEFFDDVEKLTQASRLGQLTRNVDPVGSLLRGFFQYYAQQGSQVIGGGFMWKSDIISLRTKGGLLSKSSKGWTAATTINQNGVEVRQRYLLAIECPMETDHNVARTVHHNGIVAIRDEFRRAWRILDSLSWTRQQRPEGLLDRLVENYPEGEEPGLSVEH